MDSKFIALAQRKFLECITHVERTRGKSLIPVARIMLEAVLLEAVTPASLDRASQSNCSPSVRRMLFRPSP